MKDDNNNSRDESATLKEVLIEEYKFMQKAAELQFTHFMGVFYFWTALISLPTGAGILKSFETKDMAFGLVCLFVSLIGVFLSAKMFDIRRSQIKYLRLTNQIRFALWEIGKVYELTDPRIIPMGKRQKQDGKLEIVDLRQVARTDFGQKRQSLCLWSTGPISALLQTCC
jgi:hypothetical protein